MMKKELQKALICMAAITGHAYVNAADIDISGYASFIGGRSLNQGQLVNGDEASQVIDPVNATDNGQTNDRAFYSDDFRFDPDSNLGIQVRADLSQGLTVTALISGRGSTGYDVELDWAYLSYELSNSISVDLGRKRIPLYFYSDFIDVGYAYNWVRPPVDVYTLPLNSYEGVSLNGNNVAGTWEFSGQIFGGSGSEENSLLGDLTLESIYGGELRALKDWLELRIAVAEAKIFTEGTTTDEDNPVKVLFTSVSANIELERFFILAEYAEFEADNYIEVNPFTSISATPSYYITTGYKFGDFTPHITYSEIMLEQTGDLNPFFEGVNQSAESFIFGVRWDFHPSAAFKFEYSIQNDTSDETFKTIAGEANELDTVSLGVDLIF